MNPPPDEERGSLLRGFTLGWVVLVGSWILVVIAWMLGVGADLRLTGEAQNALLAFGAMFPFVAMIALLVWFAAQGKPRSAAGVALAFASLVALVLLLVAACFGLLAGTNFH